MVWYGDIEKIEEQVAQLAARIVNIEKTVAAILYHAKRIAGPRKAVTKAEEAEWKRARRKKP